MVTDASGVTEKIAIHRGRSGRYIAIQKTLNAVSRTIGREYKRYTRLYKRNINTLNVIKLSLLVFFVLMYNLPLSGAEAQGSQTGVIVNSKLIALTSDIVSVDNTKPVIQVAQSQYQQQQAVKAAQAKTTSTNVLVAGVHAADPSREVKRALVQKAAGTFGIDWKVLEAVWQIESGKTWQTSRTSSAGALGPCQFLPSTWRSYAYDGNGDGVKDITSAQDCLYGSAKLLASNGAASGNVTNALLHYNHSLAYVRQVLKIASTI